MSRAKWGEAKRFFEEVVLQHDEDECLIWPYARNKGWAVMWKSTSVARLVCVRVYGPPSRWKNQARHLCGKGGSGCVAPRHLKWGSARENGADTNLYRNGIKILSQPRRFPIDLV